MSQQPPAPGGAPGAPGQPAPGRGGPPAGTAPPQRSRPVRRLVLVFAAVIALLLVATAANYRFGDPTRFDPTVAEKLAVTDEHGISKEQYSESGDAVREVAPGILAVTDSTRDYYRGLSTGSVVEFGGGEELLLGLDRAQQAVDAMPALANPEVAERKAAYDERLATYREGLEAYLADAERLTATASCHPVQFGTVDPASAGTLELVRECQRVLTEAGQGSSPLAGVARDSAVYLGSWAESIEAGDEDAADDGRSTYQFVYLRAVQILQAGVPRTYEELLAAGSNISDYCDRAAFVSAAS